MIESTLNIKDNLNISTDRNTINICDLLKLYKQTYWAKDRNEEFILKTIDNSLCFSLLYKDNLIGFTRVVTDYCDFAYLADVIIHENYRDNKFGTFLIENVVNELRLKGIRRICLLTRDAQDFYKRFGFNNTHTPLNYMEIININ